MVAPVRGLACTVRELNKVEVEELTFLPPGPGEVRLKIHACGLCHSDVSALDGKFPFPRPLILGHEGAGVIESIGSSLIGSWKVGDRVILTLVMPCNRCDACKAGRPSLCNNKHIPGLNSQGRITDNSGTKFTGFMGLGCMAEYAVVTENALIAADDDMPLEMGALVSCGVTTGAGAVMNRAKVQPGCSCCVVGCGGVGLSAIQAARICGAKQIIAVDMNPLKLEAARKFGATHTVNAKEVTDVAKEVQKISKGGTDYGIEAIGFATTGMQVIESLRPGGTAVMVGIASPTDKLDLRMNTFLTEKIVTGSIMGSSVPSKFVPMLCGLYKKGDLLLEEMVSEYYQISSVQRALDDLASGNSLRGVFVMHDLKNMAGVALGKAAKL